MINEQMSHSEALKILGATGDESKAELSKLFKRASLRNHPDRGGSTELMQKINQAYDVVTKTNSAGKTYSDVRAEHAANKKAWEEKFAAYFVLAKNYFSTKFNAQEFAEYFTKFTGQPTTYTQTISEVRGHTVHATYRFTSGDAFFDFSFSCQPPSEGKGLAAPDASALGSVSVNTLVLVGTKKHKMASRDYQWGKNPDKITPESLFPAKKLESIFSPTKKDLKFKRADYMTSFARILGAKVSGNDVIVDVGHYQVHFYRHVFMRKGAYVFRYVVDPTVNKFKPAERLKGTMLEDEDGACLDMIIDTFKEMQKVKPDASGIAAVIDRMNAEFAAGHRSASFVKRTAQQAAAPAPEEKPKRTVNRINKDDYFNALKQAGATFRSNYGEFDNGAGLTFHFKREISNRKGFWSFSSFNFMHSGQKHVEWLKDIDIDEDSKGASIGLMVDTLKQLRGVADWYTARKILEGMRDNFKAGKFSAPHVKKEAEQKRTETQAKDELGAQPTKPQAAKKEAPAVDKAHQAQMEREKSQMNATIRSMLSALVKAGRKDTPEEIKKAVDEAIALWRLKH